MFRQRKITIGHIYHIDKNLIIFDIGVSHKVGVYYCFLLEINRVKKDIKL